MKNNENNKKDQSTDNSTGNDLNILPNRRAGAYQQRLFPGEVTELEEYKRKFLNNKNE